LLQELLSAVSNMSIVINAIVAAAIFGEPFSVYPPYLSSKAKAKASNATTEEDKQNSARNLGYCHCIMKYIEGWDLGAVLVLVAGTVIVGLNAPTQPEAVYTADEMKDMLAQTPFLIFLSGCGCIFTFCTSILCCSDCQQQVSTNSENDIGSGGGTNEKEVSFNFLPTKPVSENRGIITAALASMFSCLSVTFSKIVVLLIKTTSIGESNEFVPFTSHYLSYVFIGTFLVMAVSGLSLLNHGLGKYDALLIIPVYYVTISMLTIVAGLLLYGTYKDFTPISVVCFLFGLSLSLSGVMLLAGGRAVDGAGGEDSEEEEEEEGADVENAKGSAQMMSGVQSHELMDSGEGDAGETSAQIAKDAKRAARAASAAANSAKRIKAAGNRRSSQVRRRGSLLLSQNGLSGVIFFAEERKAQVRTWHRRVQSAPGAMRRLSMPTPVPMGPGSKAGYTRRRTQSTF
jgi:hypothetical protein